MYALTSMPCLALPCLALPCLAMPMRFSSSPFFKSDAQTSMFCLACPFVCICPALLCSAVLLWQYAVTHPGRLALLVSVELPSLHMHKVSGTPSGTSLPYFTRRTNQIPHNHLSSRADMSLLYMTCASPCGSTREETADGFSRENWRHVPSWGGREKPA